VKHREILNDGVALLKKLDNCLNKKEANIVKKRHRQMIQKRVEVEDILVKLCSLEPIRQAVFLKDRRALKNMTGFFGWLKRALYKRFVSEKGGETPDDVHHKRILLCEIVALIWVVFLTYYLVSERSRGGGGVF